MAYLDMLHTAYHLAVCLYAILKGREALESNARDPPWRAKAAKLPMISHDKPAKKCIFVPKPKGCWVATCKCFNGIIGLLDYFY